MLYYKKIGREMRRQTPPICFDAGANQEGRVEVKWTQIKVG